MYSYLQKEQCHSTLRGLLPGSCPGPLDQVPLPRRQSSHRIGIVRPALRSIAQITPQDPHRTRTEVPVQRR